MSWFWKTAWNLQVRKIAKRVNEEFSPRFFGTIERVPWVPCNVNFTSVWVKKGWKFVFICFHLAVRKMQPCIELHPYKHFRRLTPRTYWRRLLPWQEWLTNVWLNLRLYVGFALKVILQWLQNRDTICSSYGSEFCEFFITSWPFFLSCFVPLDRCRLDSLLSMPLCLTFTSMTGRILAQRISGKSSESSRFVIRIFVSCIFRDRLCKGLLAYSS